MREWAGQGEPGCAGHGAGSSRMAAGGQHSGTTRGLFRHFADVHRSASVVDRRWKPKHTESFIENVSVPVCGSAANLCFTQSSGSSSWTAVTAVTAQQCYD